MTYFHYIPTLKLQNVEVIYIIIRINARLVNNCECY